MRKSLKYYGKMKRNAYNNYADGCISHDLYFFWEQFDKDLKTLCSGTLKFRRQSLQKGQ